MTPSCLKLAVLAVTLTLTASEPPTFLTAPYQPPATNYGTPYQGPQYIPPSTQSNGYDNHYNGQGSYNNGQGSYNNGQGSYNNGQGSYDNGQGSYNHGQGAYDNHGHGHGHESEVPKAYEFGYSVKDAQSGNDYGRHEKSDGDTVTGEYRVQLPDGRTQIVTYHADWRTGYHADVRYEGEAHYPQQNHNQGNGGYNYNAPEYTGSLNGFNNGFGYKPTSSYGPPGY